MNNITLLDGAMGSLLWQSGWTRGKLPAYANLESPLLVFKAHQDYIKNGSRFILSNTFAVNSFDLGHSLAARILNKGVSLAKEAAVSKGVHVGASIAPLGIGLRDRPKKADGIKFYAEQAALLQTAGADALVFESFASPEDIEAAFAVIKEGVRIPVIFSISCINNKPNLKALACLNKIPFPQNVVAIGVNCVAPPVAVIMLNKLKKISHLPLWVKPNAGLPNKKGIYPVKPKAFAAWTPKLIKAGAQYLGGCCGTTPETIKDVKKRLK